MEINRDFLLLLFRPKRGAHLAPAAPFVLAFQKQVGQKFGHFPASSPLAELAARNDDFHIVVEGSCGPFPKDDPRIDGRWMLLSIWGIPIGTVSVNVELGDGTVAVVPVSDAGVAQMLWEDPEDILSIQFEAMTPSQRSYASTLLPTPAIDCAPDTDSGSG